LNLDENTYILNLRSKLTKSHLKKKKTPINIKTNAFSAHDVHLWFTNIDIQFVLDPYGAKTYYTSYMTKIDKLITSKLHSIIQKCIANNINANIRIQKLGNVFFNTQQMITQLVYFLFFIIFSFINTYPFEERVFVLKPQVALNGL